MSHEQHHQPPTLQDFEEGSIPTSAFPVHFEQLIVDDKTYKDIDLEASYDGYGSLAFKFVRLATPEELTLSPENLFRSIPDKTEGLCQEQVRGFIATTPWRTTNGKTELNLVLQREELTFAISEKSHKLEAVVVNGPKMMKPPLKFECDEFSIEISQFRSAKENIKNRKLKRGYIATSFITVSRQDGASFKNELGVGVIQKFNQFLTFWRGAHCGIGHIIGFNTRNKFTYANIGFTKCDQLLIAPGWVDNNVEFELPEVFDKFSKLVPEIDISNPFYMALEYYRASNVIRESSLEMGVIASQAALETLVPHLLETRAEWSADRMKDRKISFHEKLRAAVAFIEMDADPFEHDDELRRRAENMSEKNMPKIDAYELLTRFRNRLVHRGTPFSSTGLELIGVWNLSQWLCELFLFYWLGHRGKMADRRHLTRWNYQLVDVPLPK